MKKATLPVMELEAIAATRVALGAGAALLLGRFLTSRQRGVTGWTLTLIGGLSTLPLVYDVYANRAHD